MESVAFVRTSDGDDIDDVGSAGSYSGLGVLPGYGDIQHGVTDIDDVGDIDDRWTVDNAIGEYIVVCVAVGIWTVTVFVDRLLDDDNCCCNNDSCWKYIVDCGGGGGAAAT